MVVIWGIQGHGKENECYHIIGGTCFGLWFGVEILGLKDCRSDRGSRDYPCKNYPFRVQGKLCGISIEGLLFHRGAAFFNAGRGETCCLAFRFGACAYSL